MSALVSGVLVAVGFLMWLPPTPSLTHRDSRRPGRPADPGRGAPGSRRAGRRREDDGVPPALALDLVAAVLESGLAPAAALRCVASALGARTPESGSTRTPGSGPPTQPGDLAAQMDAEARRLQTGRSSAADPAPPELAALREALELAAATGTAPAEPVRRAAQEQRRRAASARAAAMRRLEVLLVLPTGLCLLPAFVLLGVAPVVIDLVLRRV